MYKARSSSSKGKLHPILQLQISVRTKISLFPFECLLDLPLRMAIPRSSLQVFFSKYTYLTFRSRLSACRIILEQQRAIYLKKIGTECSLHVPCYLLYIKKWSLNHYKMLFLENWLFSRSLLLRVISYFVICLYMCIELLTELHWIRLKLTVQRSSSHQLVLFP